MISAHLNLILMINLSLLLITHNFCVQDSSSDTTVHASCMPEVGFRSQGHVGCLVEVIQDKGFYSETLTDNDGLVASCQHIVCMWCLSERAVENGVLSVRFMLLYVRYAFIRFHKKDQLSC